MGDASNAYGKVISPLWLKRGAQSDVHYTPENGWDDVPLKTFRRHIVHLGNTGYIFIYDELEAAEPITWSYLLHTVAKPMTVDKTDKHYIHIQATNGGGASDAYLFSTGPLQTKTTDKFLFRQKTGCVPMTRVTSRSTTIIGTSLPFPRSRRYIALLPSSTRTP